MSNVSILTETKLRFFHGLQTVLLATFITLEEETRNRPRKMCSVHGSNYPKSNVSVESSTKILPPTPNMLNLVGTYRMVEGRKRLTPTEMSQETTATSEQ